MEQARNGDISKDSPARAVLKAAKFLDRDDKKLYIRTHGWSRHLNFISAEGFDSTLNNAGFHAGGTIVCSSIMSKPF